MTAPVMGCLGGTKHLLFLGKDCTIDDKQGLYHWFTVCNHGTPGMKFPPFGSILFLDSTSTSCEDIRFITSPLVGYPVSEVELARMSVTVNRASGGHQGLFKNPSPETWGDGGMKWILGIWVDFSSELFTLNIEHLLLIGYDRIYNTIYESFLGFQHLHLILMYLVSQRTL